MMRDIEVGIDGLALRTNRIRHIMTRNYIGAKKQDCNGYRNVMAGAAILPGKCDSQKEM